MDTDKHGFLTVAGERLTEGNEGNEDGTVAGSAVGATSL